MGLRKDQLTRAADAKVGDYYGADGDERIIEIKTTGLGRAGDNLGIVLVTDQKYGIYLSADSLVPIRKTAEEVLRG